MRCLVKDAFRTSRLWSAIHIVRVGRCYYRSSHIPYLRTVDDESLVKVNVGVGRQVDIRIRQPPRPEPNSPIIIFLKRGIPTATNNEKCIKSLALGANAAAVEIDYSLSKQDPYPAPIHTVLAGYDWIQENLACGNTDNQASKIGVCGELVGGSLATMLALTECFHTPEKQERQGISALAVGNPILDWTALFKSEATRNALEAGDIRKSDSFQRGAKSDCLSANDLCDIRDTYFSKAEHYFDPFASPLLFFRTPGCEIPDTTAMPPTLTGHNLLNGDLEDENVLSPFVKKRRSARKYPPTGSNLLLPWTRMDVGKDCVLKDQAMDIIEMMRKSFRRSEVENIADMNNVVGRDFEVLETEGVGLWDEMHTSEIGKWLGEQLRKP